MGKRNQLSITLQWGYNNSIVGEETFIDKTGRTSKEFFQFYKNDLFRPWDNQHPSYPCEITLSDWGEKLQPYFKHAIKEKEYTYTLILTDKDVDVEGELRVRTIDHGNYDFYTLFQWWNKESREGGIEIVKNNPVLDKLDWKDKRSPYPVQSESGRQGFYSLFDHRDQDPGHPQEFFIVRLKEMLGDQVGNMPISNDNYYTFRYLRWMEGYCQLTLLWDKKGETPDERGPQESRLVKGEAYIFAEGIGVQLNPGLPAEGYWKPFEEDEERCVENAYQIAQFDHQVDFDKYSYAFAITPVITCFA